MLYSKYYRIFYLVLLKFDISIYFMIGVAVLMKLNCRVLLCINNSVEGIKSCCVQFFVSDVNGHFCVEGNLSF